MCTHTPPLPTRHPSHPPFQALRLAAAALSQGMSASISALCHKVLSAKPRGGTKSPELEPDMAHSPRGTRQTLTSPTSSHIQLLKKIDLLSSQWIWRDKAHSLEFCPAPEGERHHCYPRAYVQPISSRRLNLGSSRALSLPPTPGHREAL